MDTMPVVDTSVTVVDDATLGLMGSSYFTVHITDRDIFVKYFLCFFNTITSSDNSTSQVVELDYTNLKHARRCRTQRTFCEL